MGGVAKIPAAALWLLLGVVVALGVAATPAQAFRRKTNHYDFVITETNVTRLCQEKTILTVNGQFPGPTIHARQGDVVFVNVHNRGRKNITLHWHGVDQPRNPWFDGPEFITQCPIQPGANFTYRIVFSNEEGTLWWHAHSDFDRATVHGAIVVRPKLGSAYPYPEPHRDIPIILGEWWNVNVEHLLEETMRAGGDFNISDANTINGQPGDLFPCSRKGTFRVPVERGRTYMLRVINAGLTNDMFFAVAGHNLTVVGSDGHYLKPFTVGHIMIAAGQTMNVLLHADRAANASSRYYMAARTFATNMQIPVNNSTATAVLEYSDAPPSAGPPAALPDLPAVDDLAAATAYTARLRSLATDGHPVDVPTRVDERMLVTISVNALPCATCEGPINGTRFAASLNNVSFVAPAVDILDAYYSSVRGVYEPDFPDRPPLFYNFTAPDPADELLFTKRGTKVKVVEYGAVVEVVFQGTALGAEPHPMHLHGFAFYAVGRGFGNFDESKDPATYNLVDPPRQNTVSVPAGGWAAIRFRATNPGVWFMHCHFDRHTVWGMDTVFIVKNGKTPDTQMLPRPPTMPKC
jgi:laccase